jgi:hypothetical protein
MASEETSDIACVFAKCLLADPAVIPQAIDRACQHDLAKGARAASLLPIAVM